MKHWIRIYCKFTRKETTTKSKACLSPFIVQTNMTNTCLGLKDKSLLVSASGRTSCKRDANILLWNAFSFTEEKVLISHNANKYHL